MESLLPKLKLKQVQRDESWAEALKITENMKFQPAMSHKSRINSSLPTAVVYFKKNPYEGTVQLRVRKAKNIYGNGKVRMLLRRKGHPPLYSSNFYSTSEEAFENIRVQCISTGRDVPAMSHKRGPGVKYIHQIYGLFRDGKEMSGLFQLSSSAWRAYAVRHQCTYVPAMDR